jgi:hypothetical protein
MGRRRLEGHSPRPSLDKNVKPYLKNNSSKKRSGDVAQVVKLLPSKLESYEFKTPVWQGKKVKNS